MSTGADTLRVLVVGESWIKHTVHMKGFDQFQSVEYEEGAGAFLDGLVRSGFDVTYIRAHEITARFPTTAAGLDQYSVIVVSDIGSNSFLLCDETFLRSERGVNRLELLRDYVLRGGGLVMVGGYMSFAGIDARARYGSSPLAAVLPVTVAEVDDRVELPQGLDPEVVQPGHELLDGVPADWPFLLGYNKVVARPGASVLATIGEDPLLVVEAMGDGRAVAFTSDLAPHWAPPEFVAWEHYDALWASIMRWASASVLVSSGVDASVAG